MSASNARRRELARERHRNKTRGADQAPTFTGMPAGRSGARLHPTAAWPLEQCLGRGAEDAPDLLLFTRRDPESQRLALGAFSRDPSSGRVVEAFSADDLEDWELEDVLAHLSLEEELTERVPTAAARLLHLGVVAGARNKMPPPPSYGVAKGILAGLLDG